MGANTVLSSSYYVEIESKHTGAINAELDGAMNAELNGRAVGTHEMDGEN